MGDEVLLHGTLHATIYEVDGVSGRSCCLFCHKLTKKVERCVGLGKGTFKLYTAIDLGKARVCRTRLVESSHCNPKWNESLRVYCAHMASHITFSIKGFHRVGAKMIGTASMPVGEELLAGKEVDRWLQITKGEHHSLHRGSKIHVKLRFESADREANWSKGIGNSSFSGVPCTFFPQMDGCKVSLYQDAHVPDEFTSKIHLPDGQHYHHRGCWEDIFQAISNAKHFIYIAGWSVYPHITLVRDHHLWRKMQRGNYDPNLTLGELLKKKASEGVRVLMLVWDDRTSVKLLKKDGVMKTHDEDTEAYFSNTGVQCVLCPRNPDEGQTIVKDIEIATMFSHHQKIVVVDSEDDVHGGSRKRRIVSFIGGIDLCDGRYDTPSHSIFRSLGSAHIKDFHQPNFHGASIHMGGPREPWHDVHCRLEGPVAWDVLVNFEQRWRKQGPKGSKGMLLEFQDLKDVFIARSESNFQEDSDMWKVQIFRSIDGGAAHDLLTTDGEALASRRGLVLDRGKVFERSIQDAYVNAIRRAKNFIYIENQYFLGSSFCWKDSNKAEVEEVGADNLIPKELSLKIVSKIQAGERFSVYIVVPMWPEGIPESDSVQGILHWQKRTMEMMYSDVIKALKGKGIEEDPMNYLTFFCLGNREVHHSDEYAPDRQPEDDTNYGRAQKNRRFMIYVHAKTMIVDDEYIIVGSANINQRSMDGSRDTEIAMGGHQPHHLAAENPARGQIYGFRKALWHEHMGEFHGCFDKPQSLECISKVNEIAYRNWDLYSSQTVESDLPSHLLKYPIAVTEEGEVAALHGMEHFPDTRAKVLGSKSLLPTILTT
ncbi:hypothetical protein SAY87_029214 [Trapa incisa]|uniref:Phospholipase D n=1 Tax=Trapa incisa TaxID=236973 RepID=A0AAN7KWA6_9MYRT|nr:hypothetical protein SAY87_029214 [Trapa incisa]